MRHFWMAVLLLLALAGLPRHAPGCWEPDITVLASPGVALVSPARTAPPLAVQGVVVDVVVRDCSSVPIENYPRQDVWLGDEGARSLVLCQGGSIADADTDADGHTTISGAIAGGGNAPGFTRVYVSGIPVGDPVPVRLNSPDLTADLVVDVSDFSVFGLDFASAAFRSDLVHDGTVDLADFSAFGLRFGETCP